MASPEQHGGIEADLARIARLLPPKHLRALADQLETAQHDQADGDLGVRIRLDRGHVVKSSFRQPELEL